MASSQLQRFAPLSFSPSHCQVTWCVCQDLPTELAKRARQPVTTTLRKPRNTCWACSTHRACSNDSQKKLGRGHRAVDRRPRRAHNPSQARNGSFQTTSGSPRKRHHSIGESSAQPNRDVNDWNRGDFRAAESCEESGEARASSRSFAASPTKPCTEDGDRPRIEEVP